MAMSLKDFRQLEKLMVMTTSDNDAEALSALRLANKTLAKYDYTWASAFQRLVKVDTGIPDVEDGTATIPNADREAAELRHAIETAFDEVAGSRLGPSSQAFIDSLRDQWERHARLSERQREALFKYARGLR